MKFYYFILPRRLFYFFFYFDVFSLDPTKHWYYYVKLRFYLIQFLMRFYLITPAEDIKYFYFFFIKALKKYFFVVPLSLKNFLLLFTTLFFTTLLFTTLFFTTLFFISFYCFSLSIFNISQFNFLFLLFTFLDVDFNFFLVLMFICFFFLNLLLTHFIGCWFVFIKPTLKKTKFYYLLYYLNYFLQKCISTLIHINGFLKFIWFLVGDFFSRKMLLVKSVAHFYTLREFFMAVITFIIVIFTLFVLIT